LDLSFTLSLLYIRFVDISRVHFSFLGIIFSFFRAFCPKRCTARRSVRCRHLMLSDGRPSRRQTFAAMFVFFGVLVYFLTKEKRLLSVVWVYCLYTVFCWSLEQVPGGADISPVFVSQSLIRRGSTLYLELQYRCLVRRHWKGINFQ